MKRFNIAVGVVAVGILCLLHCGPKGVPERVSEPEPVSEQEITRDCKDAETIDALVVDSWTVVGEGAGVKTRFQKTGAYVTELYDGTTGSKFRQGIVPGHEVRCIASEIQSAQLGLERWGPKVLFGTGVSGISIWIERKGELYGPLDVASFDRLSRWADRLIRLRETSKSEVIDPLATSRETENHVPIQKATKSQRECTNSADCTISVFADCCSPRTCQYAISLRADKVQQDACAAADCPGPVSGSSCNESIRIHTVSCVRGLCTIGKLH